MELFSWFHYLYNGKELNADFGLNLNMTRFRSYDATIGIWLQVDPLAEAVFNLSPYHFSFNNPISFSDPLGLMGQQSTESLINQAWKNTKDGKDATYSIEYNPYGGEELSRRQTNNGVNIQYSGGFSLR